MAEHTGTQGGQRTSRVGAKYSSGSRESHSGQSSSDEGGVTEQLMSSARETFENVTGKAGEYIDRASDYLGGFNANPANFIRNHPVQSAIGGVIVGFILGSAVSRRALD